MKTMYDAPNPIKHTTFTQPVTLAQKGPRDYSAKSSYHVEFVFSAHPINIIPTYQDTIAPNTISIEP